MQPADVAEKTGTPEEMFLYWFLQLPANADVAQAARSEIARIDGSEPADAGMARLRGLLLQATLNQPSTPRHRRRTRH